MKKRQPLRVFAPATVANVAVGYDILGFPINDIGDEVKIKAGVEKGLVIKTIYKNKGLSKDIYKNTAGLAAQKVLESLGLQDEPIQLELYKHMDIGTGLGSSASSAVAGAFGVNEYLGRPYSKQELLKFATIGEQVADGSFHADNVAPSLLGSFILIRDNDSLDYVKLPVPPGLKAVIVHPKIKILTKDSREILKSTISLDQHIKQSGNLAAFVSSLYRTDLEMMSRSLSDCIIEPQRAHLIPHFQLIKESALSLGAIGCSISGAGPSIFCLCIN
ncbi:MAG: homoserine kinase, partial [Saprospiraceae bacterium]|nr:homoserine kinase [Saprospiraceae bacterium]